MLTIADLWSIINNPPGIIRRQAIYLITLNNVLCSNDSKTHVLIDYKTEMITSVWAIKLVHQGASLINRDPFYWHGLTLIAACISN